MKEAELLTAQIDSGLGNFKDAYTHYRQYILFSDELKTEKVRQSILRGKLADQIAQDKTEQNKRDAIAQVEISKQKIIRNAVMGGSIVTILIGFLIFANFKNKIRREKAELVQQVSSTEMKVLRSQMNPHFIFNALQSIQAFLLSHQSQEVNNYLIKFSRLMRLVLENSQCLLKMKCRLWNYICN